MTISSHLIIMQSSTLDQHAVEKLDSQRSSKTDLSPYEDVLSYYSLAFLKRNTKVVQSRGQIKAASGQQKMQFYGCYHNSISIQVCKTHVKVVGFAIKSCQGTGYVKYESRKYFYKSIQTIQKFKKYFVSYVRKYIIQQIQFQNAAARIQNAKRRPYQA